MRFPTLLTLLLGLLAPAVLHGQYDAYIVFDDDLWRLDMDARTATRIGPTGQRVEALAFSPYGVLYGVDLVDDELLVIDPATGAASAAGHLGGWAFVQDHLTDLAFDAGGGLRLVARFDPNAGTLVPPSPPVTGLFAIDIASGEATPINLSVLDWAGLARSGGSLVAIDQGELVTLDATGTVTAVVGGPSLPSGVAFRGLDADPVGRLWAMTWDACILGAPCPVSVGSAEIDPATGQLQHSFQWTGLPDASTAGPLPTGLAFDPTSGKSTASCFPAKSPAATMLLPYFEVDVDDPGGRDTLVSVGNTDESAALVHAVLWTNWGLPALSFDFFVPAGGVRSLRVRDLIAGRLPVTTPPELPEGVAASCHDPLALPVVDPDALRATLTGQPDATDGLCHSSAVEDGRLATGYLTFDVVRDCSGAVLKTPFDDGYFEEGGSGLATNDNVLWGDFYLVDPSNDFAEGERLVALVADVNHFGSPVVCVTEPCPQRTRTTFYDRPDGNRAPLAKTYRARYLSGGAFLGTTELVIWQAGQSGPEECGSDPDADYVQFQVSGRFRNESGETTESHSFTGREHTLRARLGDERFPVTGSFGSVDLGAGWYDMFPGIPAGGYSQLWVMPLLSAEGRYSVGIEAVAIEDFCP